jgi:hypothetical protein
MATSADFASQKTLHHVHEYKFYTYCCFCCEFPSIFLVLLQSGSTEKLFASFVCDKYVLCAFVNPFTPEYIVCGVPNLVSASSAGWRPTTSALSVFLSVLKLQYLPLAIILLFNWLPNIADLLHLSIVTLSSKHHASNIVKQYKELSIVLMWIQSGLTNFLEDLGMWTRIYELRTYRHRLLI